ncbi:MAG: hypothetical protein QOI35_3312 [Cryptosporangiaceae bacterium]|jgi:hypothetical protein|nr:hypothetical protein [Cryptosporangiaceae bacterium]MDQ1654930.1 hypothetical protein [Cryptosporangiaceae bacterium]
MLFVDGALGLVLLGLWIFCLVDVITTPEWQCRHLPKVAWVLIVLLLPEVGSIVWLVAGRPRADVTRPGGLPYKGNTGYPEYERPGRHVAQSPDDDEAFLRGLRERAEEQRRKARDQSGEAT